MTLSVSIVFVTIVFLLLVCKLIRGSLRRGKLPPGPTPWPIVGNLANLTKNVTQCFNGWSETYGPIISVWFGSSLNVVVSSSNLAREVLNDNDQQLAQRHRIKPVSIMSNEGTGIVWADYNHRYVKLRKICRLELFSPRRMEALRPIREEEVKGMIDCVFKDSSVMAKSNPGGRRSLLLRKYLRPVVLNCMTTMVLGRPFYDRQGELNADGLEFKAIIDDDLKLTKSLFMAKHIPWLSWMFRLRNRDFRHNLAQRNRFVTSFVEDCKKRKINATNPNDGEEDGDDRDVKRHRFINVLLGLAENHEIDEQEMIGMLWDMTASGMETSVIAVEYAMAELVINQAVQNKVHQELETVIGFDKLMNESDIPNLPYLQSVTKETLRLHPPAPLLLPHKANGDVRIGDYDVPKGSIVHVNVSAIGRDPTAWSDSLEFRPERFLDEDVEIKGNDFRLIPFGAGRRMCPASQLGVILISSMVGNLLHHFHWHPPPGTLPQDMDMSPSPGVLGYMNTPLQAVPSSKLPPQLYPLAGRPTTGPIQQVVH